MPWKPNPHPLYTWFFYYAAAGMALLGLGVLARSLITIDYRPAALLLGIWPNLLGSLATPFVIHLLLFERKKDERMLDSLRHFALANLITLAGALLIEAGEAAAGLGAWDQYDITASILSGAASAALFLATTRSHRLGRLRNARRP